MTLLGYVKKKCKHVAICSKILLYLTLCVYSLNLYLWARLTVEFRGHLYTKMTLSLGLASGCISLCICTVTHTGVSSVLWLEQQDSIFHYVAHTPYCTLWFCHSASCPLCLLDDCTVCFLCCLSQRSPTPCCSRSWARAPSLVFCSLW